MSMRHKTISQDQKARSLNKHVWQHPESFSQTQLIRILKNIRWQTQSKEDIFIHASAFTDNSIPEIIDLLLENTSRDTPTIIIETQGMSLTSDNAIIPPYLHEILLKKFYDEQPDFLDFLNLLSNVFYHIDYKLQERNALLLRNESDRRLIESQKSKGTVRPSLTEVISRVCATPLKPHQQKWVQYSHLFGIHSRSLPQLTALLRQYFTIHISITSQLLCQHSLEYKDCTRLQANRARTSGYQGCHALGQGFLLGKKVWMTDQQLFITLFPDTAEQLQTLLDNDDWKKEMAEIIAIYLRDKTRLVIQTHAPQCWYHRIPLSSITAKTIRLGRGFYLTSNAQSSAPLVTINHRSKE